MDAAGLYLQAVEAQAERNVSDIGRDSGWNVDPDQRFGRSEMSCRNFW
jgi:hypothetical protein